MLEKRLRGIILLGLILGFLVTLPVSYVPNSIFTILIGLYFFVDSKQNIILKLKQLTQNKLFAIFFLLFSVQLVGCLYSEDTKQGFKVVKTFLPFIALPITIFTEKLIRNNLYRLLKYFVYYVFVVNLALLLFEFYQYGSVLKFEQNTFTHLGISTFYYSAFIFISIFILLFGLKQKEFNKLLGICYVLFFVFMLFLLSARISILVLIIGLVIFGFTQFKSIKYKNLILISALSVTIGGAYVTVNYIPQLRTKFEITTRTFDYEFDKILTKNRISITRNTLEYRVLINYCSFQIFASNIFGVGTGDARNELLKKYKSIHFKAGLKKEFNAHNQYMEEAVKTGVLGLLLLLFFVFYLFKISSKTKTLLFYVVLYISIVCLTESYLYRHHGIMFTAFFVPLFYRLEKLNTLN